MRRLLASLASLTVVMLALVALPGLTAQAVPGLDPSTLAHVGEASQVIVVTAPAWSSTTGTLQAFQRRTDGTWEAVIAPTPARLGWGGLVLAAQRHQGSGTTPAGTFALVSAFGRQPDPGTGLPYLHVDRNDAWPYNPADPATYNVLQTANRPWRGYGGYVEHLWAKGPQYDYAAVLDYNLPAGPVVTGADGVRRVSEPADTRAGGGIFLHVTKGQSTAGCVAIPRDTMRQVLRWLDSARHPVIVIGPAAAITRM